MRPRGNRNALNRETGEDGLRDWSFGMYDCLDTRRLCNEIYPIGSSLLYALTRTPFCSSFVAGCWATFCPCVVYGQNRQRLISLHRHDAPLQGGVERCNHDCRLYCCMSVPCFFWVFQVCANDGRVRSALNPAALRWGVGLIFGIAMTSVERASKIFSTRYVVARARSRRKAGRLSWRRRVSPSREAYQLRPRTTLDNLPIVSPVPLLLYSMIPTFRVTRLTVQF